MDNILYDVDVDENGPFITPLKNKPVFCGQEPSFMGGAFNTEEDEERVKSQAVRLSKEIDGNPVNLSNNVWNVFLHGKIENLCEYDIPVLIDGTVPDVQYGNIVECIVYDIKDRPLDCYIVVGKSITVSNKLYCLIVLKDDIKMIANKLYPTTESDFSFLHSDEEE